MSEDFEILDGPEKVGSEGKDAQVFRWRYRRGKVEQDVLVQISGSAMSSAVETLPSPVSAIVATQGRAAVEDSLARGHMPERITVDSSGAIWEHPAD